MPYRIEIVADECMSSGKCIGDFPTAFVFDDDELALVVDQGRMLDEDEMIRAARNCPSQAVRVFDESNEQVAT